MTNSKSRVLDWIMSPVRSSRMKQSILSSIFVVLFSIASSLNASVNVTQEHNNLSRDGVYIDSAFTPSAAANLARDLNFNGVISGNVLAQPLYIEGGPTDRW